MVLFGLFHGLAFLPVVLSIVGPPPYKHTYKAPQSLEMTESKTLDNQDQTTLHTNGHIKVSSFDIQLYFVLNFYLQLTIKLTF